MRVQPGQLVVTETIRIEESEVELSAIRAQGAGGQNVNKLATAIHLRFDVRASSLPDEIKQRILASADRRLSKDGVIVIKAQRYRTQEANRQDALQRLLDLLRAATRVRRRRKPTRPGAGARRRRLDSKTRHGRLKALRAKLDPD